MNRKEMKESNKPESNLGNQLKKAKNWIKSHWKKLFSYSRAKLIFLTAIIEIEIIYFLFQFFGSTFAQEPWVTFLKGNGIWTFIVLLISAPIAFLVWKFRDENTVHQLENQRKDINLKEFQKIAEWVSGLHLVEDKIVEKTKKIENPAENNSSRQEGNQDETTDTTPEIETSREYGQAGTSRHIPSHSRQDGSVGLQVAAVYMLKPFYCGEHGDGFRRPALNLLTSAWLALFKQVENSKENQSSNQNLVPNELRNSPLTIALTEVLLADNGIHLHYYPEIFPNLYLPYLNLSLPGLNEKLLKLFSGNLNCTGINLKYANLEKTNFNNTNLQKSSLQGANLDDANLNGAKLDEANCSHATFIEAKLNSASLYNTKLNKSHLDGADLNLACLSRANLTGASLSRANLSEANLKEATLDYTNLSYATLENTNLESATMIGACLDGADLTGAHLINISLNNAQLDNTILIGTNLYLADLSNINIKNDVIWQGTLLDTENIKKVRNQLSKQIIESILQAPIPKENSCGFNKTFRFKKDGIEYIHTLDHSLTIEELQELNPQWIISIKEKEQTLITESYLL